jgi:hypothetical protein
MTALIGIVAAAAALATPLPPLPSRAIDGGTGVYSLDPNGAPRLIVRTKPRRQVAFWG